MDQNFKLEVEVYCSMPADDSSGKASTPIRMLKKLRHKVCTMIGGNNIQNDVIHRRRVKSHQFPWGCPTTYPPPTPHTVPQSHPLTALPLPAMLSFLSRILLDPAGIHEVFINKLKSLPLKFYTRRALVQS